MGETKLPAPLPKEDKERLFPESWMHSLAYASIHEFSAVIVETMPTQLPPSEYPGATPHTEEQEKYVKMDRLACAAFCVPPHGALCPICGVKVLRIAHTFCKE